MIDARLAEGASSANDYARLEAAEGLGGAGPEALPFLRALVTDRNDFVRQAAKTSVYRVAREHGDLEAARLGIRIAADPNLHLRATAWQGLKLVPRDLLARAYTPPEPSPGYGIDCLNRNQVPAAGGRPRCDVCVAFLATPGFEGLLDMCLQSLRKNGGLAGLDHALVAFMPGADDACREVCRRHGALCIEPLSLVPPHASMKGMAYSLPRWVDARCYLSIEPDMLVLGSLREIVERVLDSDGDRLYAVESLTALQERDAALRERGRWEPDLREFITRYFAGDGDDVRFLLGDRAPKASVFCNGGLFLGGGEAFRRVEEQILSMQPFASLWIDTGHVHWREEMVWNIAYSLAGNVVALPKSYNWEPEHQGGGLVEDPATGEERPTLLPPEVRVMHFMGAMKGQMPRYMRAYGIP